MRTDQEMTPEKRRFHRRIERRRSAVTGGGVRSGKTKLEAETSPSVMLGTTENLASIHTSCSKPIDVGSVYGPFTVTKMINKADF